MKIFFYLLCLYLPLSASSQNLDSFTKVNEIDFLNLKGEFYFNNSIYYDKDSMQYGVFEMRQCVWISSRVWHKYAKVADYIIADYFTVRHYGEVNYDEASYYFKTKEGFNFFAFLKENTVNGKLRDKDKLTLNGKKLKLYRTVSHHGLEVKLSGRV